MKRVLSFIYCFFVSVCIAQNTVNYTESNLVIANPERGLQKYSITDGNYNTTTNYSNISLSEITSWRTGSDKVTLIFRYFLLSDFLNSSISATYLANMQKDFDIIRTAGLKCIVRFSYSDNITTAAQQPTKSRILTHINQIASLLDINKDVIVTHQAGFIGTYGEWYYTNSTEFGTEGNISASQWQNRKEVVDAMLSATPVTIPIQVRYPLIKKTLYGNNPLTQSTAFQNTALARIGFFNDAFLNDYGDQGTYEVNNQFDNPVGTADYTYLSNETKYTPMSGETNGLNPPRTSGANAVTELDATNWSFMNRDYFEQNITNWIASGHFDTMVKKLGYRFVLSSSTFTLSNSTLSLQINLENKGFAKPFKERIVYLVLKNNSTNSIHNFALNTDLRNWDTTIQINQSISLSSLPDGQYSSYLYLPDSQSGLQNRSEYSIQMANTNIWDSTTGLNNLNQTVTKTTLDNVDFIADSFRIYPNPVISELNIDLKRIEPTQIIITDITGKKIVEYSTVNLTTTFSLDRLMAGMYSVTVNSGKEKKTYKVIKL